MDLHPSLRQGMNILYGWAAANGWNPRITSTVRTRLEQTRLYNLWLQGKNPYPVAVPGTSKHERGLAFDMVSEHLDQLGAVWTSWGGRWGGSFGDPVHFELR